MTSCFDTSLRSALTFVCARRRCHSDSSRASVETIAAHSLGERGAGTVRPERCAVLCSLIGAQNSVLPQQNGVAERTNRTLADGVTAMLAESGLPQMFWGEAVLSLVHILNCSFTTACPDATPYKLWYRQKPDILHLRVWGCAVYVHGQKDKCQGLSLNALSLTSGIFLV